jgi:hypothetical protein
MNEMTSKKDLARAWVLESSDQILAFASEIIAASPFGDYYGDDPHRPHPGTPPPVFQPKYVALLYLGLMDNWALQVNHACYELPASITTSEGRRDFALDILKDKVARNVTFGLQNLAGHLPYEHQKPIWDDPARLLDSGSLNDFKFKSPNEIFVFLHHEDIDLDVYDLRLIGFKNIGADNNPRRQNDTFYNTRAVPNAELGNLSDKGTLIRVENYATGIPSMTDPRVYSMDIKFRPAPGRSR